MRKLASFDNPDRARALHEALAGENIASELRPDTSASAEPAYAVWIVTEEQLLDAKQLLAAFMANPDAARFENARRIALQKRAAARPQRPGAPRRVVRAQVTFSLRAFDGPVTALIIAASVAVSLLQYFGLSAAVTHYLSIASYEHISGFVRWHGYDDVLLHGQVWRLFTPILIHFGLFHILFNVMWMLDLGASVERYQGSLQFACFMLFCAVVSNVAQLELGHGPNFGGLSGIVYALVGYVWARGRFDPSAGIAIRPQLVTFFMFWLVLGFTGVIDGLVGSVANYCHLGGLSAGAAYGYVAARRSTRLLRR